jgi:hypothetical protein
MSLPAGGQRGGVLLFHRGLARGFRRVVATASGQQQGKKRGGGRSSSASHNRRVNEWRL